MCPEVGKCFIPYLHIRDLSLIIEIWKLKFQDKDSLFTIFSSCIL